MSIPPGSREESEEGKCTFSTREEEAMALDCEKDDVGEKCSADSKQNVKERRTNACVSY